MRSRAVQRTRRFAELHDFLVGGKAVAAVDAGVVLERRTREARALARRLRRADGAQLPRAVVVDGGQRFGRVGGLLLLVADDDVRDAQIVDVVVTGVAAVAEGRRGELRVGLRVAGLDAHETDVGVGGVQGGVRAERAVRLQVGRGVPT
ncbi:hypothetical protein QR680_011184 [Steinernema hermaphroditum]|uniref:Uncharacterized protein n=1 Tax=Steinernema hermaphroditum TaxID=289476 RepID=A0AA39ISW3_9BILA|nr:hypothetical protein QR680_011184 [Steinernema hermaphroditum]